MLAHHGLYPPRRLKGKGGILEYIQHVGCIQFDPINIVGRNPDLVLQSRVQDYVPELLDELLYVERQLIDGWDKMASIYSMKDWPHFSRYRVHMNRPETNSRRPPESELNKILGIIQKQGPVSSLDFSNDEIVDWFWGPTKIARAALESLFSMGKVGVHHRVNSRRSFDIIENLVPSELLDHNSPFKTEEAYQDWHILRRIGGMGLASAKSGEFWYGILGVKSNLRCTVFRRLTERGDIIAVGIETLPRETFFIRSQDRFLLDSMTKTNGDHHKAAFIAALDNLTWNREVIRQIFDFEYVWEVYKPKTQRQFGYYVLPVIYEDQFIGRFEPVFDKGEKTLTIKNWWWEDPIPPGDCMLEALQSCMTDFAAYLGATKLQLGSKVQRNSRLRWMDDLIDPTKFTSPPRSNTS